MEELNAYRQRMMEQAQNQLVRLRSRVADYVTDALHTPLEQDGWSAHQVLVHMRDIEQHVFLRRIVDMLEQDQPDLVYFDEGAWMEQHYDPRESAPAILDEFEHARMSLLNAVRAADPAGWSREGRHPTQGLHTVQWWFEYALRHTQEHLDQLSVGSGHR